MTDELNVALDDLQRRIDAQEQKGYDKQDIINYTLFVMNKRLTYLCGEKLNAMRIGIGVDDIQNEIDLCRHSLVLVKEIDSEQ